MVGAHVATDVLTLVEVCVVHVFFHAWLAHVRAWAHDDAGAAGLVGVVQDVSISNILSMNRPSTFDHWQLLSIQVLVRVGGKTSGAALLFLELFIIAAHH